MSNEEKARCLESVAQVCFTEHAAQLRKAAAYFRSLVVDEQGLLPCPMCGPRGKPTITGTFQGDFNAICKTCSLRTVYHMEKADAIAAWNQRGGVAHEP